MANQLDILERLMKYGDHVLGESSPTNHGSSQLENHSAATATRTKKKKRNKSKTKKDMPEEGSQRLSSRKEFEEELKTFQERQKKQEEEDEAELDRRKDRKMKRRRVPEVIVFEDPTIRKKEHLPEAKVDEKTKAHLKRKERELEIDRRLAEAEVNEKTKARLERKERELEMERVRHDVWKFGISGFSFGDKEKHEQSKAIQLGAKPPKRAYMNYKELMEVKKQKKIVDSEQREMNRQMGMKTAKKKQGPVRLENKGFWTDKTQKKGVYVDGQVGKYKRGVQVITKRDMTKIKTQKSQGRRR